MRLISCLLLIGGIEIILSKISRKKSKRSRTRGEEENALFLKFMPPDYEMTCPKPMADELMQAEGGAMSVLKDTESAKVYYMVGFSKSIIKVISQWLMPVFMEEIDGTFKNFRKYKPADPKEVLTLAQFEKGVCQSQWPAKIGCKMFAFQKFMASDIFNENTIDKRTFSYILAKHCPAFPPDGDHENCLTKSKQQLRFFMKYCDCNNKGKLSSEELFNCISGMKNELNEELKPIHTNDFILKSDLNDTGFVTYEQMERGVFRGMYEKHFLLPFLKLKAELRDKIKNETGHTDFSYPTTYDFYEEEIAKLGLNKDEDDMDLDSNSTNSTNSTNTNEGSEKNDEKSGEEGNKEEDKGEEGENGEKKEGEEKNGTTSNSTDQKPANPQSSESEIEKLAELEKNQEAQTENLAEIQMENAQHLEQLKENLEASEEMNSELSQELSQLNNGAPDANNGAPDANNGAPDANNGAPDANNGAPDANNGAPDANNGAPDANNGAPDAFKLQKRKKNIKYLMAKRRLKALRNRVAVPRIPKLKFK